MVDDESEVISIYYGADTEEAEAEELATVWRRLIRIVMWN